MVHRALTTLVVVLCFSIAKSFAICSTTGLHCRHDRDCCSGFCDIGLCAWTKSGNKGVPGVKLIQSGVKTHDPTIKQANVVEKGTSYRNEEPPGDRARFDTGESSSGSSSLPYCSDETDYSNSPSDYSYDHSSYYSESEMSADDQSGDDSSPENKSNEPEDPSNNKPDSPEYDERNIPKPGSRPVPKIQSKHVTGPEAGQHPRSDVNWPTTPDSDESRDWQCAKDSDFCRQDSDCCSRLCQDFTCALTHPELKETEVADESGPRTSSIADDPALCRQDYSLCNQDSDCCSQECFAGTRHGGICVPPNTPSTFPLNDQPKENETKYFVDQLSDDISIRPALVSPKYTAVHPFDRGYRDREEFRGLYSPTGTYYPQERPPINYWPPIRSPYPYHYNKYSTMYPYGRPGNLQQTVVRPLATQEVKTLQYPFGRHYPIKDGANENLRDNANVYESEISLADIPHTRPPAGTYSIESIQDTSDGRHYNLYEDSSEVETEDESSLMPEEHFRDNVDRGYYSIYQRKPVPLKTLTWPLYGSKVQVDPFRRYNLQIQDILESEISASAELPYAAPPTRTPLMESGSYTSDERYYSLAGESLENEEYSDLSADSHLHDYSEESYLNIDLSTQDPQKSIPWLQHGIKSQADPTEIDRSYSNVSNVYESEIFALTDLPNSKPPRRTYSMESVLDASGKHHYIPFGNAMEDHLQDYDERGYQSDIYKKIYAPIKLPSRPPDGLKGKFYLYGRDNIQPESVYKYTPQASEISTLTYLANNRPPARTHSVNPTLDTSTGHYNSFRESIETEEEYNMLPDERLRDFGEGAYYDIYGINQVPQKKITWPPHGVKGQVINSYGIHRLDEENFIHPQESEYLDSSDLTYASSPERTLSKQSLVDSSDEDHYNLYGESEESEGLPEGHVGGNNEGTYESEIYETKEIPSETVDKVANEIKSDNYQLGEDDLERKEGEQAAHKSDLSTIEDVTNLPERMYDQTPDQNYDHYDSLGESLELDQSILLPKEYVHDYDEGDYKFINETQELPQQPLVIMTEINQSKIGEIERKVGQEMSYEFELSSLENLPLTSSPIRRFEPTPETIEPHLYNSVEESLEVKDKSNSLPEEHLPSYDEENYKHFIETYLHERQPSNEIKTEFEPSTDVLENRNSKELARESELSTFEDLTLESSQTREDKPTMDTIDEHQYNSLRDSLELEDEFNIYESEMSGTVDVPHSRASTGSVNSKSYETTAIEQLHSSSKASGSTGGYLFPDYIKYPSSYEETENESGNLERIYNTHESVLYDEVNQPHSQLEAISSVTYEEAPKEHHYSPQESSEEFPAANEDNFREDVKAFNLNRYYTTKNKPNLHQAVPLGVADRTYSTELVFEKENKRRNQIGRKRVCKYHNNNKKCRYKKHHKKCKRRLDRSMLPEDAHAIKTGPLPVFPSGIQESLPVVVGRTTEDLIHKQNSREPIKTSNELEFASWITRGARVMVG